MAQLVDEPFSRDPLCVTLSDSAIIVSSAILARALVFCNRYRFTFCSSTTTLYKLNASSELPASAVVPTLRDFSLSSVSEHKRCLNLILNQGPLSLTCHRGSHPPRFARRVHPSSSVTSFRVRGPPPPATSSRCRPGSSASATRRPRRRRLPPRCPASTRSAPSLAPPPLSRVFSGSRCGCPRTCSC